MSSSIWKLPELIPPQQWEMNLVNSTGFTLSMIRFAVAFFASLPLAMILRRITSPKGRHIFSLITGFLLIYYPFGNGCLHAIITSIVTYVLMLVFPRQCGTLTWFFAMPYLIANHIAQASGMMWKEGQLDFTGAQMVLTLKLIAISMCYQDGVRRNDQLLRDYAKSKRLSSLPSLLEFFSYCFAAGNLLSGPFFEAKDYFEFMNLEGDWSALVPVSKSPSGMFPGLYRFFKALVCAAVWQWAERSGFNIPYIESESWRQTKPFLWRLILLWFTVVAFRFKYYFVWGVSEAGLVFSGFGFAGYKEERGAGKADWNRYVNSRIRGVELNPSLSDTPKHWNICTGVWLRHYVYERLLLPGHKPRFHHLVMTQIVSGAWHGVFAGYWLFFGTSALMFKASHILHRYERNWPHFIKAFPLWKIFKIAMTAFILNYAGSAFMVLSFSEATRIWASLHYFGHIIIIAILLVGITMPPVSQKHSKHQKDD